MGNIVILNIQYCAECPSYKKEDCEHPKAWFSLEDEKSVDGPEGKTIPIPDVCPRLKDQK